MANPVINSIDRSLSERTPAGYPTMPGYQPGATGVASSPHMPSPTQVGSTWGNDAGSGAQTANYGSHYADPRSLEQQYQAPSADAVDRGVITYDDIFMRTGMLFAALLVAAGMAWMVTINNPSIGLALSGIGGLVALLLAFVNVFKRSISPALIVGYAVAEGVLLGSLSAVMEFIYPGIVAQAVLATIAVFAVTLLLFRSGKVRNSPKMQRIVLVGLIGLIGYRMLSMLASYFGMINNQGFDYVTVAGIPLGLIIGVLAVALGTFALIGDFDTAQRAVAAQVPKVFAWQIAFGLMVTIVWLYIEILRLIAILRDN